MPNSMTGMGKAAWKGEGFSAEVELKTVNNRFLVVKSHLPDILQAFEPRIQQILRRKLVRGTVDLFIRIKKDRTLKAQSRVNREALDLLVGEVMKRIRAREMLAPQVQPELLLGLPGCGRAGRAGDQVHRKDLRLRGHRVGRGPRTPHEDARRRGEAPDPRPSKRDVEMSSVTSSGSPRPRRATARSGASVSRRVSPNS